MWLRFCVHLYTSVYILSTPNETRNPYTVYESVGILEECLSGRFLKSIGIREIESRREEEQERRKESREEEKRKREEEKKRGQETAK